VRTPELNKDRRATILRWLRGGLPLDVAARMTGVPEEAVRVWRAKSVQGVRGYAMFDDEVRAAMAEGEAMHVARITAAGKNNWRASAWLLERMYPDRWTVPEPIDAEIPDAPPTSADDLQGL